MEPTAGRNYRSPQEKSFFPGFPGSRRSYSAYNKRYIGAGKEYKYIRYCTRLQPYDRSLPPPDIKLRKTEGKNGVEITNSNN